MSAVLLTLTVPQHAYGSCCGWESRQPCRYIFGDNVKKDAQAEESEKVAMTSPVRMELPSETISMTAPVQMKADTSAAEGNGSEEQTYKCAAPSERAAGCSGHQREGCGITRTHASV
jgi:hypothetical protein